MSTVLERIIDGASDPSVSTADLLRRAITAAHRLRAERIRSWAESELSGYGGVDAAELPVYRRSQESIAQAHWTGFGGSSATTHLSASDAPKEFAPLFGITFYQSVSELESLAAADGELGRPWPAAAVGRWNQLIDAEQVVHVSGMYLFSMKTECQKHQLVAVIDAVRTEVLKLALDLESAGGRTGEVDGPTVEDPAVQSVLTTFITNVYGPGAAITQAGTVQEITVNVGDLDTLTHAARSIGLDDDAVATYVEAVVAARDDPERSKLSRFLSVVKAGSLSLAGGVASNIAADQLLKWAMTYLGN